MIRNLLIAGLAIALTFTLHSLNKSRAENHRLQLWLVETHQEILSTRQELGRFKDESQDQRESDYRGVVQLLADAGEPATMPGGRAGGGIDSDAQQDAPPETQQTQKESQAENEPQQVSEEEPRQQEEPLHEKPASNRPEEKSRDSQWQPSTGWSKGDGNKEWQPSTKWGSDRKDSKEWQPSTQWGG